MKILDQITFKINIVPLCKLFIPKYRYQFIDKFLTIKNQLWKKKDSYPNQTNVG